MININELNNELLEYKKQAKTERIRFKKIIKEMKILRKKHFNISFSS